MRTETPPAIRLEDYAPPAWLVDELSLTFRLQPEVTKVVARMKVRPNPQASGGPLFLHGEALKLIGLMRNNQPLREIDYLVSDTGISLSLAREACEITVETEINPSANSELSGLYRSNGIYCTQCEAEGFRRITYFPDRPDILSKYRVRIEAEKASNPILLSNGNLLEQGDLPDGYHYALWQDPFPKPSYLFALVAGDLADVHDEFTTQSGRKVQLSIFVEHGKENRCGFAMEALKRSMAWDEEAFGLEYDLDRFMIVAVSDFNMGAMENKGLNIFNDKYILALPETATDVDFALIEAIIAHEYFHNWTGNRITCRDWFQLCLKEGLTVYRDQEFSADMRSRAVKRIEDVRRLRARQFPEDNGPLSHAVRPSSYVEINNFYTATVYEKGAEICRMIEKLIGKQGFRKGMDLYFARHDGQAARVEDFIAAMADANNVDFTQFFRWYTQAGTPLIEAQGHYDAAAKTYELHLKQAQAQRPGEAEKLPLHMPLSFGLVGPNGADMEAGILELTQAQQSFHFSNIPAPPVLSLNRGFSAPIRLKLAQSADDQLFLMRHDGDSFNRWEAGQRLGMDVMIAILAGDVSGIEPYAQALGEALADPSLDAAYRAFLLSLPSEADLTAEIGKDVNPDLVHAAREALRAGIGGRLKPQLLAFAEAESATIYSPDPEQAGIRALRFAAMALIAAHDAKLGAQMALSAFQHARSMSEEMGALQVLCLMDVPERRQGLDLFHAKHRDDHLLIDKWLMLEAMAPMASTVGRVQELLHHPDFKLATPNKVHALLGGFAGNAVAFNAADGQGYRLFAQVIGQIDAQNPQLAARLAGGFRSFRLLEPARQAHARAALENLRDKAGLSRDSLEIITRSLG